jgi:hypothetical protein
MKISQSIDFRVNAGRRYALAAFSMAAIAFFPPALGADGQDSDALKTNISRAAVTTMPAYTVEEAPSTKTHTLFMGADIAIALDRDQYHVKDVWGSNWVIDVNGREKEISAKQAPVNLKITPSLKLTENAVTIVGFKRVEAYSYANDPSVRLTKGLSQAGSLSNDLLAISQNAQYRQDVAASNNMSGAGVFVGADDQFSANAMLNTAKYTYSNTHATTLNGGIPNVSSTAPTANSNTSGANIGEGGSQFMAVGLAQENAVIAAAQTANGNEPAGKIATSGLDAMDVEFDVRSARPLHNPYLVTMARFRTRGGKTGMVQNLVYAQSLHPIDEHLSHVHFVEEGFPFNYELLDFQLHVYNRGEEIATNLAADRVELTRDEAFEYVKAEYIGAHPKDTLPATPAMAKLPADLPTKLAQGKYNAAFYVKVTKDGLADEAYSDPACTRRIDDPYLDSVVKRVRFKPALNAGKPIDGVAVLNLGKLAI